MYGVYEQGLLYVVIFRILIFVIRSFAPYKLLLTPPTSESAVSTVAGNAAALPSLVSCSYSSNQQRSVIYKFYYNYYCCSSGGIVITPADSGANVGNSFTFNCTLTDEVESEQLFLAINGELEGEDFNRTSSVIDPPGSVTYTFNGVSLSDQGTIFQCLTSRQSSKLLSLIVYCKSLVFMSNCGKNACHGIP